MREDKKEYLRGALLPVLLGDSVSAHALSAQIYARFGVVSYVCDSRRRFWSFVDPTSRFFDLIAVTEGGAVLAALEQIASNSDYLPVLIACNERFERFVADNKEVLEPRFIISTKEDIWNSAPFAALMKGE